MNRHQLYIETYENLCRFGQFLNSDKKTKMLSDFLETLKNMIDKKQNAGINQVSNTIQTVNSIVQKNSAISKKLDTSNNEMTAQTEKNKFYNF